MSDWTTLLQSRWSKGFSFTLPLPLNPFSLNLTFFSNARLYTLVASTVLMTFILLDLYLWDFVASLPDGTLLPISTNTTSDPCFSSPFCTLNVKSLMMDPPDFYVHDPGSVLFVRWLDLPLTSWMTQVITANSISFLHLLVALGAGRLVAEDSLCLRRLGVMLYQLRNFLDEVDGAVGSDRRKKENMTVTSDLDRAKVTGYWVDGLCDGLGSSFLLLGCFFYLQKHPIRHRSLFGSGYTSLLPLATRSGRGGVSATSTCGPSAPGSPTIWTWIRQVFRNLTTNCPGLLAIGYGFQALIGTVAWNRFIIQYTALLEVNQGQGHGLGQDNKVKANLLRSPVMWMVFLAWRYVNPHTWIEILLMAIFFDRMGELLYALRLRGFIIVSIIAGATEAHLQYTTF